MGAELGRALLVLLAQSVVGLRVGDQLANAASGQVNLALRGNAVVCRTSKSVKAVQ